MCDYFVVVGEQNFHGQKWLQWNTTVGLQVGNRSWHGFFRLTFGHFEECITNGIYATLIVHPYGMWGDEWKIESLLGKVVKRRANNSNAWRLKSFKQA